MKPVIEAVNSGMSEGNGGQPPLQPQEVWPQLTPTQQQIVFQTLVLICHRLLRKVAQASPPEVPDE